MLAQKLVQVNKNIYSLLNEEKKTTIAVVCTCFICLLIDAGISNIGVNIPEFLHSILGITIFSFFILMVLVTQYILFNFINLKIKEIRKKNNSIWSSYKLALIFQLTISLIMITILIQILLLDQYQTLLLVILEIVSFTLAVIMCALISYRFISWYLRSKDLSSLMFGLTFLLTLINYSFYLGFDIFDLFGKDPVINAETGMLFERSQEVFLFDLFDIWIEYTDIFSYFLLWLSTAILLRSRAKNIGTKKYWTIMSIPIIYYLSYSFFSDYIYYSEESTMLFNLIYLYGFIIGKALIGIIFFYMSLKISNKVSLLRDFMIITLLGFILNSITIYHLIFQTLYPPFGLINLSLLGFSSFLIYVGLFSSAVLISKDMKIRITVNKLVDEDMTFLKKLGQAQTQKEMEDKAETILRNVTEVVKKNAKTINEDSGLDLPVQEEDIQEYIKYVIKEVRKEKT
jgi:hypothetical protein